MTYAIIKIRLDLKFGSAHWNDNFHIIHHFLWDIEIEVTFILSKCNLRIFMVYTCGSIAMFTLPLYANCFLPSPFPECLAY